MRLSLQIELFNDYLKRRVGFRVNLLYKMDKMEGN